MRAIKFYNSPFVFTNATRPAEAPPEGEIITLDKFLFSPPLPLTAVARRGTQEFSLAPFDAAQDELVATVQPEMRFGLAVPQKFQELALVPVIEIPEGEITLDKWYRQTERTILTFTPLVREGIESFTPSQQPQSTGNVFPTVGENVDRAAQTAWTNPGNIVSDNTTDATNTASSDYLVARAFGFSIPSGATIRGITARLEASESSAGTEVVTAQLQDDTATLFGATKTNTVSGTGKVVYVYGGVADLWSATITPTIVNSANFGVRFWYTTAQNVQVDFVTIAVQYDF